MTEPAEPLRLSGDLHTVLRAVKAGTEARTLVVDLDGVDYAAGGLHALAQWCPPDAVVVAVGSDASAQRIREVMHAGVADYLVKPVAPATLEAALRRLAGEPEPAAARGVVAAVAGVSGAGATTLAAALALGAAREGRYVACVDLGRLFSPLAFLLRAELPPGLDQLLAQAHQGAASAEAVPALRARVTDRLHVLGYRFSPVLAPPPGLRGVVWLLDQLAQEAHLVVVDGLASPFLRFQLLDLVDARVLVAEPGPAAWETLEGSLALLRSDVPTSLVWTRTREGRRRRRGGVSVPPPSLSGGIEVPYDASLPAAADAGWDPGAPPPRSLRAPAALLAGRLLGREAA